MTVADQPLELPPENITVTFATTLVDEWVHQGVTDVAVCPGSRSTPLAVAVAAHDGLRVHMHHDERSAGFMAVGFGLATGRPMPVICTSGTAAVELHPAVVEAHHACVPLLVVTADRPPELQGVGAPQTIDQERLYGPVVRWAASPGPPDDQGRSWWRRLAADSVASTVGIVPGPCHLNLAFREPLIGPIGGVPGRTDDLARPAPPVWGVTDETMARILPAFSQRGVIVCGVRTVVDDDDRAAVCELADALGWPVLADHLSGMRVDHRAVVTSFDPLLRVASVAEELVPQCVVHLGGLLSSRVTNEWLARSGAIHLGFDRHGIVPDPDHVMVHSLHAPIAETCRTITKLMAARPGATDEWLAAWTQHESTARAAVDVTVADQGWNEVKVATLVIDDLAPGSSLVVSSSMPVRDLEWYVPAADGVRVLANRGANGIDGVVSTAVGAALDGAPTALLIGDVAFLHDVNGLLGLAARPVDLLIVVVDNDGGGIFSFLPQADALDTDRFEQLFGTPHGLDLVAVSRAHGVPAERIDSADGVSSAIETWRAEGGARVIVVDSDRDRNRAVHAAINVAVADAVAAPGG